MARFGQRWAGDSLTVQRAGPRGMEGRMANGSLTAQATLVQAMKRLVGIRELADELVKKQETLVLVTVGQATAQVQRGFLLQVLDAEATGLVEMVRRLLPQQPPPDADA